MSERLYSKTRDLTFNEYLGKVFGTAAIGVAISAVVSYVCSLFYTSLLATFGVGFVFVILGLAIAEIAIAITLSAKLMSLSKSTCWGLYIAYSILTGVSLSYIFLEYTNGSVILAFAVTAIMFICMAVIGQRTNIDLSRFSGLIVPALIAIIAGTFLNALIFRSNLVSWAITYLGIIVFLVIVAMDVQKLRNYYNAGMGSAEIGEKLMIMSAFQLYLDFINLFIRILQIFGKRKNN